MADFLQKISGVKMKPAAESNTAPAGDINETSFSAANNQSTPVDVTGLSFNPASVSSAKLFLSVDIQATADLFEMLDVRIVQKNGEWDLNTYSVGDFSNIELSITAGGQIQYISGNEAGFVSSTFRFRATTTSK